MTALIALLTDFGLADGYVGILKAVIAGIVPAARTIDLSHDIPPQNLWAARFALAQAAPYLPLGTVGLAVVDPGVGGPRRAIALQTARGWWVGPDNGIFSGILAQEPALAAVELTARAYWRAAEASATFHGRDIFAPVAAHLALGVALGEVGVAIDPASLVQLPLEPPIATHWQGQAAWQGRIQAIDRFGNLITSLPGSLLNQSPPPNTCAGWVALGDRRIPVGYTYGEGALGEMIAIVGSHGWLEIACNGGNAAAEVGLGWSDIAGPGLGQQVVWVWGVGTRGSGRGGLARLAPTAGRMTAEPGL